MKIFHKKYPVVFKAITPFNTQGFGWKTNVPRISAARKGDANKVKPSTLRINASATRRRVYKTWQILAEKYLVKMNTKNVMLKANEGRRRRKSRLPYDKDRQFYDKLRGVGFYKFLLTTSGGLRSASVRISMLSSIN